MSLMLKTNDPAFDLPPKGKHIARCFGLIDLGVQENKIYGTRSPKILICWELSDGLMADGRPYTIKQCYTASLNIKAKLRSLLESWRGKSFDTEELRGFQLENMLSEPCYLTIDHIVKENGKKYFAKVVDTSPLPLSVHYPELKNTPFSFNLDYYTEDSYLAIPEHIRKKINLSLSDEQCNFL